RALKVAQNFLNFARAGSLDHAATDVSNLIQQTADLLAYDFRQDGISIVLDLQPVPLITIDPAGVQQVLLNLLKNAQQAIAETRKAGTVTVRSLNDRDKHVIRIEVSDDGPGIPVDAQAKIFEPLFTTKSRGSGTGLGLAVSRRLI